MGRWYFNLGEGEKRGLRYISILKATLVNITESHAASLLYAFQFFECFFSAFSFLLFFAITPTVLSPADPGQRKYNPSVLKRFFNWKRKRVKSYCIRNASKNQDE